MSPWVAVHHLIQLYTNLCGEVRGAPPRQVAVSSAAAHDGDGCEGRRSEGGNLVATANKDLDLGGFIGFYGVLGFGGGGHFVLIRRAVDASRVYAVPSDDVTALLPSMHCAMDTTHCRLRTAHYTLAALHTAHNALHTAHNALHTAQCTA